jgi:hypothetical protein
MKEQAQLGIGGSQLNAIGKELFFVTPPKANPET